MSMGVPGMTKEWKGETVYMPEAFGIKSGKSPNFGRIKAKVILKPFGVPKSEVAI
jgi:hypothetical protein